VGQRIHNHESVEEGLSRNDRGKVDSYPLSKNMRTLGEGGTKTILRELGTRGDSANLPRGSGYYS